MKLTGAQILMEVLKEEGVKSIFGYPGGAIIDIYDELAKTDIDHVLVRHEQAAVHLSLIHISEPTRLRLKSRMPSSA